MVNDDILIKYARKRGHSEDWPDAVNMMKTRLKEMKLGFPGLGNDHFDLIEYGKIKPGEIFIYDPYVECKERGDEAPIMLNVIGGGRCIIEGIGCGFDLERDPWRLNFRWQDEIDLPQLPPEFLVYRVNVRPDLNGGPGYYYFFKSYRDFRY